MNCLLDHGNNPCNCNINVYTCSCEHYKLYIKELESQLRVTEEALEKIFAESRAWKVAEKLFSEALLEFKNSMVEIHEKIIVSKKSHEQGMKGSDSLSLPWHWHQGYRDADTWILSMLDKSFSNLGHKIMGIDPVGLPLDPTPVKERR